MSNQPERQWAWKLKRVEADSRGKWWATFGRGEHWYETLLPATNQAQAKSMAAHVLAMLNSGKTLEQATSSKGLRQWPDLVNHRELLRKYIRHVAESQGDTCLNESQRPDSVTDEEWAELKRLDADARGHARLHRGLEG